MDYVQFHQPSATDPAVLVPACGDRSVVILDGCFAKVTHEAWAIELCRRRGYAAWSLHRGSSFLDSHQTHPTTRLEKSALIDASS
jgi:hypothetical protein